MSSRSRTGRTPVDLPDPEALDATVPVDPANNDIEKILRQISDVEEEEDEEEEETDPQGGSPETPKAGHAAVPPEAADANTTNKDEKERKTSVVVDSAFVPRLPSDFLEPGDVSVDEEELIAKEALEINEESAREANQRVQQYVKADGQMVHVTALTFDLDLSKGQARHLDPTVLATHRKYVKEYGVISMAQCTLLDEGSMCLKATLGRHSALRTNLCLLFFGI